VPDVTPGAFNVLNILAALGSRPDFLEAVFTGDSGCREVLERVLLETEVPGRLEAVPIPWGRPSLWTTLIPMMGSPRCSPASRAAAPASLRTFGCGGEPRPGANDPRWGGSRAALRPCVLTSDQSSH